MVVATSGHADQSCVPLNEDIIFHVRYGGPEEILRLGSVQRRLGGSSVAAESAKPGRLQRPSS